MTVCKILSPKVILNFTQKAVWNAKMRVQHCKSLTPIHSARALNNLYWRSTFFFCQTSVHFFSRLVCYLVNKKWLTEALKVAPGMKSPKRENKAPSNVAATPGCSHWEDGKPWLLILLNSVNPCATQGPVVWKWVNVNPGLNFNPFSCFFCLKEFKWLFEDNQIQNVGHEGFTRSLHRLSLRLD